MEDQTKFLEVLDELRRIAKSQGNKLSKEEIRQYLNDMGLSEAQFMAVYQYLGAHRIVVEGYSPLKGQAHARVASKTPSVEKKGSQGTQAERNRMLYRREVAALGNRDEEVHNQRIEAYLEGDISLRNEIVEAQLKNVVEQVVKYRKRNVPEEEIIAEGNLALLNEIYLLEENREQFRKADGTMDVAAFKKALEDGITCAMEAFIDEVTLFKDREETILARVNLLYEATKYLAEEYGRIPTEEELAGYTRLDLIEIRDIRGLSKEL